MCVSSQVLGISWNNLSCSKKPVLGTRLTDGTQDKDASPPPGDTDISDRYVT